MRKLERGSTRYTQLNIAFWRKGGTAAHDSIFQADGPIQKTKNRNYTIEHVIEHEYVIANMGKLKDDSKGNLKDKQSYKQSNGTYISHVIENHLIEVKNKKIIKVEKAPLRYM